MPEYKCEEYKKDESCILADVVVPLAVIIFGVALVLILIYVK